MSIEQTDAIDYIGIDNVTGEVVLTITDQREWTKNDDEHFFLIQEKINTYLSFVESREILSAYPAAEKRSILIDVVCKYSLSFPALDFYKKISSIVEVAGMKIRQRVFDPGL